MDSYTHHFIQHRDFTDDEWVLFSRFIERLTHYGPHICGPDGTGHAVINENEILFNGDIGADGVCGVFHVTKKVPELGFGHCRTNRKPYDTSVTAALIFMSNVPELIEIHTDGRISEFIDGYHLCKDVNPNMSFTIPDLEYTGPTVYMNAV